jgi:predicted RNase H-like nuclease
MLEAMGFHHCNPPDREWNESGDWFFEVYPHPAQVVLFGRDRIIAYKKGAIAAKRHGLQELRQLIRNRMLGPDRPITSSDALEELLTRDLEGLRGRSLKHYEDALDAVFCAYLAFHLWRWRWGQSELIGDHGTGYIVVPTVTLT